MKKELKLTKDEEGVIETLLNEWAEVRQLTLDWLDILSLEQLNQELPRPGLNSFAKHIYEMGEIQKIYTAILRGDNPNMEKVTNLTFKSEKVIVKTKKELKRFITTCDKDFYEVVKKIKNWNEKVIIFGVEVPKFNALELLIRHETLHHGQFIAFGYILGIKFPQSWIDTWALPIK
jgi:uncharacterized damage-inducible protein DinB